MQLNAAARAAFDAMSEGVTIIDIEGKIVFGNRAYRSFLNKEAGGDIGEIEGYRLRDLRPGARLPEVLEAGKPILHITRKEIEDFYFVNMYPIYQNGLLVGGLSVVTFLEDAPIRPGRSWRRWKPAAVRCCAASTAPTEPVIRLTISWP